MNKNIQTILELISQSEKLSQEEKEQLNRSAKGLERDLSIVEFKLDRSEKMRRTTSILLEETIEELDKKRQAVEKLALISSRQASLERIRAEIASMRKAEDLEEISPLIWQELSKLKVPYIRCGIFIVEEENHLMHVFLNTQDQQSIAVLHIPFDATSLTQNVHTFWKKQERHQEKWSETDFINWVESLSEKGFISSQKDYVAGPVPKQLILEFFPFKQGMLYIGNSESLSTENEELCQTLAGNFSVAYDRYEDFTKLEIDKKNVEIALKDLRITQDQLIQQEKLASLGQLTAGIAHEIKNPLNFVNNFSDLSIELVNEVLEEINAAKAFNNTPKMSARLEEMTDLLHTIEINLKKIYEHGSRANEIVTSMLQHSRGGSGEMKKNDLNELIGEFSNLAFHGMRAGKDPIQLELILELKPNLPKVPLIKEDFSRVIINLCTNAFDALKTKVKEHALDYKPCLTIRTRSDKNSVFLEVEDNGPGIPEKILDKILQPFFTTKQGKEGTGLGLSISHDIIKAHRGQLTIETLAGRGTKFIIELPMT